MNRRSLFSLLAGTAVVAVATRVTKDVVAPLPAPSPEYDFGGPHEWQTAHHAAEFPSHAHTLTTMEMPSHTHSIHSMIGGWTKA